MVPAEQKDLFRVTYFEAKEICDNLRLIFASINVVSHENELLVRLAKLDFSNDLNQIIILAVNVPQHHYIAGDSQQIWLS